MVYLKKSLGDFAGSSSGTRLHWQFHHTPYSIGKSIFSNQEISDLPKIPAEKHLEGEGIFRFGRPLVSETEEIVFTEHRVKDMFSKALNNYRDFLEKQKTEEKCEEKSG